MTKYLIIFFLFTISFKGYCTLDRAQFDLAVQQFASVYSPIAENEGAILEIISSWENDKVEAWASQDGNEWRIEIYGGVARAKLIDQDALLLILCHEMGHHLGGEPRTHIRPLFDKVGYWMSVEGQADYFASSECINNFFSDKNRIIDAAFNMLTTVAAKHDMEGPSIDGHDNSVVSHTIRKGYPSFQCRFDTFLAGMVFNPRPLCWYHP